MGVMIVLCCFFFLKKGDLMDLSTVVYKIQ